MGRVLVVDDEKNIRNMIRLTLAKAGHEVEVAEDGSRGLALFGDGAGCDLTLVDQRMPGLRGIEVIDRMKRRDPTARIVMMTAYDTAGLAAESLRAGAMDFLRKPFSTEFLRDAVTTALSRPRPRVAKPGCLEAEPGSSQAATIAWRDMPQVRRYLNGFYYWPLDLPSLLIPPPAPGVEARRAYHVQSPSEEAQRVVIGILPNVLEQLGQPAMYDRERTCDALCEVVLVDYLWSRGELPPAFLPVYELTADWMREIDRRLRPARR